MSCPVSVDKRRVTATMMKPNPSSISRKSLKPGPRGLFKPIKRSLEKANMIWMLRIPETRGIVVSVDAFDMGWTFGEWGSGADTHVFGEPVGVGFVVDWVEQQ
ncbi:hypothetical protein Tco_0625105 [Tanacetum coccineum]|uniref:Uncharacterized protein n=1 Tax=Tanacetum coccineum TaxID=301880 RepID=A0ABQ4WFW0_9ASTR